MLNRGKTENNFGVAFFCTEHIHFCSFLWQTVHHPWYMIGGSVREMSGSLLVSVTVAPGFIRGQSRILAFRTVPVVFIPFCVSSFT
ncbi:hypothetical protein T02_11875 [Trichinella nativa]|uniref:Uncharacterized protein n=1 Tax=Trichinella nativa TaxID=6335 RepID=A0A0V1KYH1_9BILA|nr:hypothetical protein T06_16012 [Trichinella sp. T6]KRZ52076.1 hypothetical protein T02_11875 [Trichinella nativa]